MFRSNSASNVLGGKSKILAAAGCLGILAAASSAHAGVFGTSFHTTDYYETTADNDTPVTQTQDNYDVTIQAILNGSQTVYDQTFNVAFTDPTVQQGVLDAQAALLAQGATAFEGPTLSTNTTTLLSSMTTDVVTGTHIAPNYSPSGLIVKSYVSPDVVTLHELAAPGDYADPLVSHVFVPIMGGVDVNTSVPIVTTIDRNVITTNTYLVTQLYTLTADFTPAVQTNGNGDNGGTPPPGGDQNVIPVVPPVTPAVPLPSAFWPGATLLSALGMRKWFKSVQSWA